MIKLERRDEPSILAEKGVEWLQALLNAIATHGSFKKIPDKERESLLVNYRHDDIKKVLTESSHGKCAFCECHPAEGGYIQVEHFKPKSLYPSSAFEWINLLPACAQCNGLKLNHDTVLEPIINPYDTDPSEAFYFEDISMKVTSGPHQIEAQRTIDVCGLEGIRLWKPRADILVSLRIFMKSVEEAMKLYEEADTDRKRDARLRKLKEAISTIENLTQPSSKYSAFCSDHLERCVEYVKARELIAGT